MCNHARWTLAVSLILRVFVSIRRQYIIFLLPGLCGWWLLCKCFGVSVRNVKLKMCKITHGTTYYSFVVVAVAVVVVVVVVNICKSLTASGSRRNTRIIFLDQYVKNVSYFIAHIV